MIREFHGMERSYGELEIVALALDSYLTEVENLCELDLSDVMTGRMLRAREGGKP